MTLRILAFLTSAALAAEIPPAEISSLVEKEFASLATLYRELHASPELSFHEEKSASRLAAEIRQLGWAASERVGGS